jgi:NAD(P)-dependent dehydrogenase (short-subunit alcohol dehydrogenase family)
VSRTDGGAFSGKVAIVTGGTSGIGLALAQLLASRGARVIAASSNPARVRRAGEALAPFGGEARQLDVRDRAAFRALVDTVVVAFGRVDYLFNNAGIAVLGEARDHTDEDWDDLLDVNLRGVVNGVCAVYPRMIDQGTGHIVNMSSLGGLVATPFNAGYTASKFGVVGLSQALRFEAARYGVRVSVVCPAYVETPLAQTSRCRHLDRARVLSEVPTPGETAERCAEAVLVGVARNRGMITPHAASAVAFVHRYIPWITSLMMRRLTGTVARIRDAYEVSEPAE